MGRQPNSGRGVVPGTRRSNRPLSIAAGARWLQTPNGVAFPVWCEFNWVGSTQATDAAYAGYLANRKARGINAFELMAIVQQGGFWNWSRADTDGNEPFTTPGVFSTRNPAYFAKLRAKLIAARDAGFIVFLYLTYLGFDDTQGWHGVIATNSMADCQAFGTYLASVCGDLPNVIPMFGGDRTPPNDSTLVKHVAIIEAFKAGAGYPLSGSEWNFPDMLATDQAGLTYGIEPRTSNQQLDTFYSQGGAVPRDTSQNGRTYVTANRSWGRHPAASGGTQDPIGPVMPGLAFEIIQARSNYASPASSAREALRAQRAWVLTSGASAGVNFGDVDIANSADYTHLDDVASDDYTRDIAMWSQIPSHWKRVPSGTATNFCGRNLIVSGGGSFGTDSYITACVANDGAFMVAYVPPTGTGTTNFNADLRSLVGTKTAYWVNPTVNGGSAWTPIGSFSSSLSNQAFTTPGNNGTGTNDHYLVLM